MERCRYPQAPRWPRRCLAHRARPDAPSTSPGAPPRARPGPRPPRGARLCRRQRSSRPSGRAGAPRPAARRGQPPSTRPCRRSRARQGAAAGFRGLRGRVPAAPGVPAGHRVRTSTRPWPSESRTVSFDDDAAPRHHLRPQRHRAGHLAWRPPPSTRTPSEVDRCVRPTAPSAWPRVPWAAEEADYREAPGQGVHHLRLREAPGRRWMWPTRCAELGLDGVYFIADTRREYPNGAIGGQVVGYCNVDGEGITGLELQYNDILSGTPGTYTAERGDAQKDSTPIPGGVKEETPAVNGTGHHGLPRHQAAGHRGTGARRGREGSGAPRRAASVVMDAAAPARSTPRCSLPYMNPAGHGHRRRWAAESAEGHHPGLRAGIHLQVRLGRCTILEQGTTGPEDTMFCPSSISADDYDVSDSHERDGETYSLREILNHSSNVGISLATEQAGFDKLYDNIKRFHFTELTGVDYPGRGRRRQRARLRRTGAKITGVQRELRPGHRGRYAAADGALLQRHRQRWDAR